MNEYERLFEKLFEIQGKTITAIDGMFHKFEKVDDNIKILIKLIEKKVDADEKFIKWLKVISGLIALAIVLSTKGG